MIEYSLHIFFFYTKDFPAKYLIGYLIMKDSKIRFFLLQNSLENSVSILLHEQYIQKSL